MEVKLQPKMSEEDLINMYQFFPLPWISKSAIISHDFFCEWSFYLSYIKKVDTGRSIKAETGIGMHALVDYFFKKLDLKALAQIPIDYEAYIPETRVYEHIYNTMMEYLPVNSREYEPYQIILRNFSLIEAAHWIDLNKEFNANLPKVLKYFVPKFSEMFMQYDSAMLFGTLDRVNKHYMDDKKRDIIEIYDYKTGKTPKEVMDSAKETVDEYGWSLPTKRSFELHFYVLLDILRRGYILNPEIEKFITDKDYFKDWESSEELKEERKKYILARPFFFDPNKKDKNGKMAAYDWTKDYRIGVIYLGDERAPYVPKKKVTRRSMSPVFKRINALRGKLYREEGFSKEPNFFKCKNCSAIKYCLAEEEIKLLKLEKYAEQDKQIDS